VLPRLSGCKAENCLTMLPDFRFLSAAILLSISFLVFGLGITSLLRNTHDRVAGRSLGQRDSGYVQKLEPLPVTETTLHIEPLGPRTGQATLEDDRVIIDTEEDEFDRSSEQVSTPEPGTGTVPPTQNPISAHVPPATVLSPPEPRAERKSTSLSTEPSTGKTTANPLTTTATARSLEAEFYALPPGGRALQISRN